MNLDWNAIRSLDGSQAKGFEELCAQLARAEKPASARFERKGDPDAGVECYCVLADGSEWGWQAKYFDSLTSSQWSQLDSSVRTALDKHPKLARYFVCTPLDRPDARTPEHRSAMQQWEGHVAKWSGWAQERGMSVEFVWCGSSELLDRLAQPQHIGQVYFWFHERQFDHSWFQGHLLEALKAAGPRYTREIHVDLPVAHELELFGRTDAAFDKIKSMARGIRKELQSVQFSNPSHQNSGGHASIDALLQAGGPVLEGFANIRPNPTGHCPFSVIADNIEAAESLAQKAHKELSKLGQELDKKHQDRQGDVSYPSNPFRDQAAYISRLQLKLRDAKSELRHADKIANSGLLILDGDAGTGKTHLLCDAARARLSVGAPTVLLMGQRFRSSDDPWSQMLKQLDLREASVEQFVGALAAAAQTANRHALVMIDALNEGLGREIWPSHLAAFLASLESSPWIGVVLSVRSTYLDIIIPKNIQESAASVRHEGFIGYEYNAAQTFVAHYGLEFSSTPILQHEFQNPLFLKIICQGTKELGQHRFPRGFHGVTATFDHYIQAVNGALAESLDYNSSDNLVRGALDAIAERLTRTYDRWIPRTEIEAVVNELLPGRDFSRSLYRGLVTEGLLVEDMGWGGEKAEQEVAYLAYERFSDHLVADLLLDKHLDVVDPEAAFAAGGDLAFLCGEHGYRYSGLIEALCVQIPERTGREFFELAPVPQRTWYMNESFWRSVIWRSPDAVSQSTIGMMNNLNRSNGYDDPMLDTLLTLSTVGDHPLNAEFLDRNLRRIPMADRDAWWSTYLHGSWRENGPVDRLVDWSSQVSIEDDLDAQTVDLCAISLAWMLTTSNRFLRDRATKALVSLLTGRFESVVRLVDRFADVDDPYVTERIYAVAYGVAMRTHDSGQVESLASLVYTRTFASGRPPAHILLRDYARGVVERALHLGCELTVDERLLRPPYASDWPNIPDVDAIRPLMPSLERGSYVSGDTEWSKNAIGASVLDGDFSRYVIDRDVRNWISLRSDSQLWQSPDELMEGLLCRLSESEKIAWQEFVDAKEHLRDLTVRSLPILLDRNDPGEEDANVSAHRGDEGRSGRPDIDAAYERAKQDLKIARQGLRSRLTVDHHKELTEIMRAQNNGGRDRAPRFDSKLVQRYVLWRVFDLGWSVDRLGRFDRYHIREWGRDASKPERIGKKYQWIAYHEMLAYIADHYQYREEFREDEGDRAYEGPWQVSIRDIDPSCTLPSIPGGASYSSHSPSWWCPFSYVDWDAYLGHAEWIARDNDLPDTRMLLRSSHPGHASRWLNLSGYFNWEQPHPADVNSIDVDRRIFWVRCDGYFVRAGEIDAFMEWLSKAACGGRWTADLSSLDRIFLGEYSWAPAFQHVKRSYYGVEDWMDLRYGCPVSVRPAASQHFAETNGFDCSLDESYTLRLPHHELVERFGLKWSGKGADYLDKQGNRAAFDPTAHEDGPPGLLMREDLLKQYLSEEKLALCWGVVGQKQVYGKGYSREYYGNLKISGAYKYTDHGPKGCLKYCLDKPQTDSTSSEGEPTD